jgi:hypothetical protein
MFLYYSSTFRMQVGSHVLLVLRKQVTRSGVIRVSPFVVLARKTICSILHRN